MKLIILPFFIQFVQRISLMGQLDLWYYTHIDMVSDDVKPHYSSLFYTVCSENKSHGSDRQVALHSQSHG